MSDGGGWPGLRQVWPALVLAAVVLAIIAAGVVAVLWSQ